MGTMVVTKDGQIARVENKEPLVDIPCNGGWLSIITRKYPSGTSFIVQHEDLGGEVGFGVYAKLGDALARCGVVFEEMTGGRY